MNRLRSIDAKYYLGSVSHSMEHLPKWYQTFAISGILFVIYLRDNPIISWLVVNLHSSFGTEFIWYHAYQDLLELMSFNERLCFTLYGVALATAVVLLYKFFCRDTYGLGWSATQLFPDRKGASIAMCVCLCLVEMARMRSLIADCLSEENSLANFALKGFEGLEQAGYDPRLAASNPHFVVQVELLKALVKNILLVRLPIVAFSAAFRLFRDIPRKTHAALRWYLVTTSVISVIRESLLMYMTQTYNDPSAWVTFAWAVVLLGTTNFLYGPSKRSGTVVTVTTANSLSEAVRAVSTCMALWCIASLLVLTVIVSVHVVELMSLWLIISLLIVWLPAIIDSCSTDYVTLLSSGAAWLARAMGYLTIRGTLRFGLVFGVWWFAACLVYNVSATVMRSRYGGMAGAAWFFFWAIAPSRETTATVAEGMVRAATATMHALEETATHLKEGSSSGADSTSGGAASLARLVPSSEDGSASGETAQELIAFLDGRLRWLCHLADYDAVGATHRRASLRNPLAKTSTATEEAERVAEGRLRFSHTVQTAVLICTAAIVFNRFYAARLSHDTRVRLRRSSMVLATPAVLARKAVRTLVLVFCVASFVLSTLTFRELVLPYLIRFLPNFLSQSISVGMGCMVLGALMDTKESLYDVVARVLGLMDPPLTNEDGTPIYASGTATDVMESEEDLDEALDLSTTT